jgi:ankyrin repeat protein
METPPPKGYLQELVDSCTPLHQACRQKQSVEVLSALLKQFDVNLQDLVSSLLKLLDKSFFSKYGYTPLHCACNCGLEELVDLFLRNGAQPNIVETVHLFTFTLSTSPKGVWSHTSPYFLRER